MKEGSAITRDLFVKIMAVLLLLTIAACSSTRGPVVIRESSTPINNDRGEGGDLGKTVPNAQPVSPDQQRAAIPLVEKLVVQSNFEVKSKNYEKAISLAERGLRIDRKDSRLYLVLSKAYRGELNHKQSVYFAKQGLRYVNKSGSLYQELVNLAN